MEKRTDILKEIYQLKPHIEGGYFSEVYKAPFETAGRPLAGSIYFLLDRGEVSRFHVIDCDEIWYYHEGCGMKIILLTESGKEESLLGTNVREGERAMVVIPKGCAFAAENLDPDGFTFVSCVTTPDFQYAGFRLLTGEEIWQKYPCIFEEVKHLVSDKNP